MRLDPHDPATWHALHKHPAVDGRPAFYDWYVHLDPPPPRAVQRAVAVADLVLFRTAAASLNARFPGVALELEMLDDQTTFLAARRADFEAELSVNSLVTDLNDERRRDWDRLLCVFEPADRDAEELYLYPDADIAAVLAAVLAGAPTEPLGAVGPRGLPD